MRVVLFHWKAGAELDERAARLRALGHRVEAASEVMGGYEGAVARPPDAIVIDLGRLPSHGRQVAIALRERKTTRHVPLVFVDGEPEKVARLRADLPDAVYATW